MIGSLNHESRDVTVVGAGISGLLAAYRLDRAGFTVTLIEARDRSGGLIGTAQTPWGIAESAAHSFLATPEVRELCADLGVELVPVRRDSKARFIWRDGRMRKFPLNLSEALSLAFRAYFVLARAAQPTGEMNLEQWTSRFLGEGALRYLVTPFVRGVYGCKPFEIQVGAAFPALAFPPGHSLVSYLLYRLRKKLFSGKSGGRELGKGEKKEMVAPRDGMESLVRKLEQFLENRLRDRFRKGTPVLNLPDAGNIVLAVPAHEAAHLLSGHDPQLSEALRKVNYTSLIAVTSFVQRASLPPKVAKGVGVLVPEREGRDCLGVLFNSSAFSGRVVNEDAYASFTMMLGGTSKPELMRLDDEGLSQVVEKEFRAILGLGSAPLHLAIRRWPQAIPQYNADLSRAWELARQGWCARPGRILFGNFTGQVSLRGMIESSVKLAAGLQPVRT